MKDWGILWKRISSESGQHIVAFINFWAIAKLGTLAMDKVEEYGKDLLWYAFVDRRQENLPQVKGDRLTCLRKDRKRTEERHREDLQLLGNGPDGYG